MLSSIRISQLILPVFYDRARIVKWLGSQTVSRARELTAAVSGLAWQDDTLTGRVQDSPRRVRSVRVRFREINGSLRIEGRCSCPVGYDCCKHVAALLIAGLDHVPVPVAGVRPELTAWVEKFRAVCAMAGDNENCADVRSEDSSPAAEKVPYPQMLTYVIGSRHDDRPAVLLYNARLGPDGTIRSIHAAWSNVEAALVKPPKFVAPDDLPILRSLRVYQRQGLAWMQFLREHNLSGYWPTIWGWVKPFKPSRTSWPKRKPAGSTGRRW